MFVNNFSVISKLAQILRYACVYIKAPIANADPIVRFKRIRCAVPSTFTSVLVLVSSSSWSFCCSYSPVVLPFFASLCVSFRLFSSLAQPYYTMLWTSNAFFIIFIWRFHLFLQISQKVLR